MPMMGYESVLNLKWSPLNSDLMSADNLDYTASMELKEIKCSGAFLNSSCPEFVIKLKRNYERYLFEVVLPASLQVALSWVSMGCPKGAMSFA